MHPNTVIHVSGLRYTHGLNIKEERERERKREEEEEGKGVEVLFIHDLLTLTLWLVIAFLSCLDSSRS